MIDNMEIMVGEKVGDEIVFKGHVYDKVKDGFCANEGWSHVIIYKGHKYKFSDLLDLYYKKADDGEVVEILPDIKMEQNKLDKKWFQLGRNNGFEWEFRINLNTKLSIEIYYEPLPIDMEKPKILWISGKARENDEKGKKLKIHWNNDTHFFSESVLKEIPVKDMVNYPDMLGKGVNGCVQLYNYMQKGLYIPMDESNGEFTLNDVLTNSANYEEQIDECMNSEYCGYLYKKYNNGSLKELDDHVRLNEVDGKFYLGSNGYHRICLLKRIKADRIYAKVDVWKKRDSISKKTV